MRWRIVAAIAVIAGAGVVWGVWRYAPSAALMIDLSHTETRLRRWLPVRVQPVTVEDLSIPTRHGPIAARAYIPASPSAQSIVAFPGIHAGGVNEPRLVDLATRLAGAGPIVVTVPLPDLRRYRVTSASTDAIEDAAMWVTSQPRLAPRGRAGLLGVSFAGGLALVAAGRPSMADRVSFVVSLGGHGDLPRVMTYLARARPLAPGEPPPHDYGTVVILRKALPRLVPADQVEAADAAVMTFLDASSLDATDRAQSQALFEAARSREAALPEPSRSIVHLVNTRDVAAMGARVAALVEELGGDPALSPMRSPATRAPVFLIHGRDDNVIPSDETPRLARYLTDAGNARVRWLLTPLLSHANVVADAPLADVWRLVKLWTAILDID
jgi:dienelactone hydrolase